VEELRDPATRGPNTTYIVDEPGNTREWCRVSTYGGKLSENITQAICRDLLAEAMLRIDGGRLPDRAPRPRRNRQRGPLHRS
jgi:hypothetical protein